MKPTRFIYAICVLALVAVVLWMTPRSDAQKPRRKAMAQPVVGKQSATHVARRAQLTQRGSDPRMLLTRAAIFDPLIETPAPLRFGKAELAATAQANVADPPTRRYFIIQYQRTIQPAWTDALRAQGVELTGYLPNNAYIVKATDRQMQQARTTNGVRWISAYGAGLKVAPELADAVNEVAEPQQHADRGCDQRHEFRGGRGGGQRVARAPILHRWFLSGRHALDSQFVQSIECAHQSRDAHRRAQHDRTQHGQQLSHNATRRAAQCGTRLGTHRAR